MMEKKFTIDKQLQINGPVNITVTGGDMAANQLQFLSNKTMEILNDHWYDAKYALHSDAATEFATWFVETFDEIAKEHRNGETVHRSEVVVENDGTLRVNFDVDCGRSGVRVGNYVWVNKTGKYVLSLDDAFCDDINGPLRKVLEEKIKTLSWKK